MAGGSGGMGRFRLGAKRISWPDWVRATAIKSAGETTGSVSDTDVRADSLDASETGTGSISTSISIAIAQGVNGDVEADSSLPQINTVSVVNSGDIEGDSPLPVIRTIAESNNGVGEADSPIPTIETVQDATNGEVSSDSSIPTIQTINNSEIALADTTSSVSTISTISNAESASGDATGSIGIVTWKAGLGGVVKDPDGNAVQGAEVHIIRDNDNVKVDSTTTNSNGRWHSTLPGGKTTDADPEVYSIEVWYRDGPKRDSSATLYNAKNKPFIDTADPSETSPYE